MTKMTSFRCPYCKKTHPPPPSPRCPHCGKDMIVPGHLRKTTFKDRQKMRERIAKDADKRRRALLNNDFNPGQNPAIIGLMVMVFVILGGLVISRVNMTKTLSSRPTLELRAENELQALRVAAERFRIDCDRYPTESEGLKALVLNPGVSNWGGHYVNKIQRDPWHTPYHYSLTNNTISLFSCGLDQQPGTDDDIHATTPSPDEIQWQKR